MRGPYEAHYRQNCSDSSQTPHGSHGAQRGKNQSNAEPLARPKKPTKEGAYHQEKNRYKPHGRASRRS